MRGWLVCGPLGHFVAGTIDWVAVVGAWQLRRLRARVVAGRR